MWLVRRYMGSVVFVAAIIKVEGAGHGRMRELAGELLGPLISTRLLMLDICHLFAEISNKLGVAGRMTSSQFDSVGSWLF